jgi:hypothetical protein
MIASVLNLTSATRNFGVITAARTNPSSAGENDIASLMGRVL